MNRPYGVHAIGDIYHPDVGAQTPDGKWVAAVAVPYDGNRLRAAWWILTGRAYAMLWPKAGDLEAIWRREPRNLQKPGRPFESQNTAIVGETLLKPPFAST